MALLLLSCAAQPIYATLIVQISVRDGIVLCADRRATITLPSGSGFYDKNVKIFQLGNECLYTITGLGGLGITSLTGPALFSLNSVIENYFRQHNCSGAEIDKLDLSIYLYDKIGAFLKRHQETFQYAHVLIFNRDKRNALKRTDCTIVPTDRSGPPQCHCFPVTIPSMGRGYEVIGDAAASKSALNEEIGGRLKEDKRVQAVLQKVGQTGIITLSDAEIIGRGTVREASTIPARGHRLGDISPECDCIHMGSMTGITWLNKPTATTVVGRSVRK